MTRYVAIGQSSRDPFSVLHACVCACVHSFVRLFVRSFVCACEVVAGQDVCESDVERSGGIGI